ncbi:flavin reductase family protein [Arthrobacter sp. Sa2BUA2]|uniref:Flavin reductase family protein n=1 Tax=Arthrobacter pullicola TaxID=2762224 RepID=A0ABR8YEY8_9MICC|nr:flavin reductase family protein [Arthrobacter pullicola]MBD8042702.1 flavin reductase family protein [Arthrobacter pullicola]
MRTDFKPAAMGGRAFYRLLTSVVVPRPIAWVSTVSSGGVDNLAPHSFFTVASVDPPMVSFTSVGEKDSLRNIRQTGEFVISLAPEELFEAVNATGTGFASGVSEFDAAGIAREPSATVRPPRVASSPVALECRLHEIHPVGDCFVVYGEIIHAAVAAEALDADTHPRIERLRPLSRLGLNEWGTIGEVRTISRIPADEWPGHYQKG